MAATAAGVPRPRRARNSALLRAAAAAAVLLFAAVLARDVLSGGAVLRRATSRRTAADLAAAAAARVLAGAWPTASSASSVPLAGAATDASVSVGTGAGEDLCRASYPSCWRWKSSPRLSTMRLALVGNELFQQLPTIGYGGIETSVDNIAAALHRMGIPFFAVVPGRRAPYDMPFKVLETAVAPNGKGGKVDEFVEQVRALLKAEAGGGSGGGSGSGPPRLVVWGQSLWSQRFADLSAVTVVSHHDGGGPRNEWNRGLANVRHRFLSRDQMGQWVHDTVTASRSRVVPHGLPRDAFLSCADGGYFLWVASLDWGWKEKGADIFVEMARRRPQYKFVAYGSANGVGRDFVQRLYALNAELPNFEFRGELKRGKQHLQAFCGATAFVMPTHASIGESFGMTVIESLSKGVPVIASTNGAVPEILDVVAADGSKRGGRSRVGATCAGEDFDCYTAAADHFWARNASTSREVLAYAWNRYDGMFVVDQLLNMTLLGLEDLGEVF